MSLTAQLLFRKTASEGSLLPVATEAATAGINKLKSLFSAGGKAVSEVGPGGYRMLTGEVTKPGAGRQLLQDITGRGRGLVSPAVPGGTRGGEVIAAQEAGALRRPFDRVLGKGQEATSGIDPVTGQQVTTNAVPAGSLRPALDKTTGALTSDKAKVLGLAGTAATAGVLGDQAYNSIKDGPGAGAGQQGSAGTSPAPANTGTTTPPPAPKAPPGMFDQAKTWAGDHAGALALGGGAVAVLTALLMRSREKKEDA